MSLAIAFRMSLTRKSVVSKPTMPLPYPILAREPWNDTGVDLRVGASYCFDYAMDPAQPWKDAFVSCDPIYGHNSLLARPMKRFCRMRGQNYYVLIGCIGRDKATFFPVFQFRDKPYQPDRSGRLWVFANDVPGFYWNNYGRLSLQVHNQNFQ